MFGARYFGNKGAGHTAEVVLTQHLEVACDTVFEADFSALSTDFHLAPPLELAEFTGRVAYTADVVIEAPVIYGPSRYFGIYFG